MSAARHVKAVTAGIAECVTEDHLPIRWNYGTRPAKYWPWRAIRRCNPFPSLSNNNYLLLLQLQTATTTAGTELRTTYCDYETATSDYNCELQQLLPSVKPGTLSDRWLQ